MAKGCFSVPVVSPMIQGKPKRRVKEGFTLVKTPFSALAGNLQRPRPGLLFLCALFLGFNVLPAAAQKPGDFAAGIYAYQQKDFAAAYQLLEPLAKQGHSSAQYNLGRMYVRGEGAPKDYVEAYKWFFLADKNGRKEGNQAMRALAKSLTDKQIGEAILRAGKECCALKR